MSEHLRPIIPYFRIGREDDTNQSKRNTIQSKAQKQLERLGLLFRNGVINEEEYREFVGRVKEKYTNE